MATSKSEGAEDKSEVAQPGKEELPPLLNEPPPVIVARYRKKRRKRRTKKEPSSNSGSNVTKLPEGRAALPSAPADEVSDCSSNVTKFETDRLSDAGSNVTKHSGCAALPSAPADEVSEPDFQRSPSLSPEAMRTMKAANCSSSSRSGNRARRKKSPVSPRAKTASCSRSRSRTRRNSNLQPRETRRAYSRSSSRSQPHRRRSSPPSPETMRAASCSSSRSRLRRHPEPPLHARIPRQRGMDRPHSPEQPPRRPHSPSQARDGKGQGKMRRAAVCEYCGHLVKGTGHPQGDANAMAAHLQTSSKCLAARGFRPCKEECQWCGKKLASGDPWARKQHSWHCKGWQPRW